MYGARMAYQYGATASIIMTAMKQTTMMMFAMRLSLVLNMRSNCFLKLLMKTEPSHAQTTPMHHMR